jgi:hypothetical protein
MTVHNALLTIAILMIGPTAARAQEPPLDDLATANALYVDGRRLVKDGQLAEACSRFEASMRLAPRLGVQFNLADCYERLGKIASAWVTFGEVAALARRMADRRETIARERQAALVSRLSHLRITLSSAPIEGLAVLRDGVRVDTSAYGVAIPVDPGGHSVSVSAPGRIGWSTRVVVPDDGASVTVEIPALDRAAPVVPDQAPASKAVSGGRRLMARTWIAGGVALAGIGAGTAFGLAARSLWHEARPGCTTSRVCTDAALDRIERSRRYGNISTAAFAVGGAALAAGAYFYLSAPRGRDRAVQLAPELAPRTAGLLVTGVF